MNIYSKIFGMDQEGLIMEIWDLYTKYREKTGQRRRRTGCVCIWNGRAAEAF